MITLDPHRDFHMVAYTDGGCRPSNPGNIGYGIHAYVYCEPLGKGERNTGCSLFDITKTGYIKRKNNKSEHEEVKVLYYVDATHSFDQLATNNYAELCAIYETFKYVKEHPQIKSLHIRADSQYAMKSICEWTPGWKRNGWKNSQGIPVSNQAILQDIDALYTSLKENVSIKMEWVKGHNEGSDNADVGNEKADRLATMGVYHSTYGLSDNRLIETEPSEYWNSSVIRNLLFTGANLFFFTGKPEFDGYYYLSTHAGSDDLIGMRSADTNISVIKTTKEEYPVEVLKQTHHKLAGEGFNTMVAVVLQKLYKPQIFKDIQIFKDRALFKRFAYRNDLYVLEQSNKEEPVSKELVPPLISHRLSTEFSWMRDLLDNVDSQLKIEPLDTFSIGNIQLLNITSSLYEEVEKVVKKKKDKPEHVVKEYILKPTIIQSESLFKLKTELNLQQGKKVCEFRLDMGIDMPTRNSLKAIETRKPLVYLAFWQPSSDMVRYACIVHTNGHDGCGVWCNPHANILLV